MHSNPSDLVGQARLAAQLFDLLPSARFAEQLGDKIDGWISESAKCHDNIERWLVLNPSHRALRGWLHAPYLTAPGIARFLSHSIVVTESGELIDVSLPSTEWRHPFIEHPGPEEEFLAIVADNGCAWIDHRDRDGVQE